MALRMYFDGSRAGAGSMTLAALAAHEDLWRDFESQWSFVLADRGNAPYSHMREAMPLAGAFSGWAPEKRDWLVFGLKDLIAEFTNKPKFHAFTCTVDVEAHTRWKRRNRLPPPERLCARLVFPQILNWYGGFPDPILDVIDVFFDRNEPFIGHIQNDWNSKKVRKHFPVLGLVRTIAPADMRLSPALQATDMLAWARNRLATPPAGLSDLALRPHLSTEDRFSLIAKLIFVGATGWHVTLDEHTLATRKFPEP